MEPVLAELTGPGSELAVYSQDDPAFPESLPAVVDDTALEHSFRLGVEIVPTLIRLEDGRETGRAIGWHRDEWRGLTGIDTLGAALPGERPGCGSLAAMPGSP